MVPLVLKKVLGDHMETGAGGLPANFAETTNGENYLLARLDRLASAPVVPAKHGSMD